MLDLFLQDILNAQIIHFHSIFHFLNTKINESANESDIKILYSNAIEIFLLPASLL